MLSEPKLKNLNELVRDLSKDEIIWMNGYLAGVSRLETNGVSIPQNGKHLVAETVAETIHVSNVTTIQPAAVVVKKMTLAFGTETNNSKKLATQFAAKAKQKGVAVKLTSLEQYKPADIAKEENFFVVMSTQGEGEPPKAAKKFYDYIFNGVGDVSNLNYSVLALGDTSYPMYCKAGEDVDVRLDSIGAKRAIPMMKCDVDFASDANNWFEQVLSFVDKQSASVQPGSTLSQNGGSVLQNGYEAKPIQKTSHTKKNFEGVVSAHINLNDLGSSKETYHIEIACEEEIEYLPGDAIGVVPENNLWEVEKVLSFSAIPRNRKISFRGEEFEAEELFTKKISISFLPERIIQSYAKLVGQKIPSARMNLADLIRIYPFKGIVSFDEVIAILEPITPRLYSIASSPAAHSGQMHITLSRNKFLVNDDVKYGLCSDWLSHIHSEAPIKFYVHRNNNFKLPSHVDDVIMIGPGTGIAPFRSFLAERDATGAGGRNWLFFGEQHFLSDFLYQTELQSWKETGVLSNISLAWSRDQQEKIYVQHRMKENAAELWSWIESGACIYLCGAKEPMSVDVENTLLDIIITQGNRTETEAKELLDEMEMNGRYSKDVY